MNLYSDISDEEFVPFLHDLGVETYKKSFEWLLNDTDFAGVLRWLYRNLDQNNALTPREEYRYGEIAKRGGLLSEDDLECSITEIKGKYHDICLPGEKEDLDDLKLDINMQKERLAMLEKQEACLKDLIKQNELTKEALTKEVTKLTAAQRQCQDEENLAAEECLKLAEEVEDLTEGVMDIVADALEVYSSCQRDKEMAKKFFTFGPLESYRQSQALFNSHFDLFTSRKFSKRQNDKINDDDLRMVLLEAKSMEDRLTEAIYAYIKTEAELSGEQAKITLVNNYTPVHPSQITVAIMEAQSAVELLEQEESIVYQQLQSAVTEFVEERTRLTVDAATRFALTVRSKINSDLSFLLDTTQQALSLDRIVYYALRQELRTTEELLQFSAQLKGYVKGEEDAICKRIESMNEICSEQLSREEKLLTSDILHNCLSTILNVPANDAMMIFKSFSELKNEINDLNDSIQESYKEKENRICALKQSYQALTNYVLGGCTKQPQCWDRIVSSLSHTLRQNMENVDARLVQHSSTFASVKSGDKQGLRKLWQWFLTDQSKLLAAIKNGSARS